MRRFVFAAFALIVFAACQPATTELTEEQKAEIEADIRQVTTDAIDAGTAHDVERWMSYYADDARWGSHLGPWFGTTEGVDGYLREQWSQVAESTMEVDEMFVRVLGPDAALVGWTSHGTTVLVDGQQTNDRMAMTLVWQRIDGVWKIVHGSVNMLNEPM